jgi:hypothetical protein
LRTAIQRRGSDFTQAPKLGQRVDCGCETLVDLLESSDSKKVLSELRVLDIVPFDRYISGWHLENLRDAARTP